MKTAAFLTILIVLGFPAHAQQPDTTATPPTRSPTIFGSQPLISGPLPTVGLITIGSVAEDRKRLAQILGLEEADGFLIRSPSAQTTSGDSEEQAPSWAVVLPELRIVSNSSVPFSINEEGMWAGRGMNWLLMTGARIAYGPVTMIFAPRVVSHSNTEYQTVPAPAPDRHPLSSLWHHGLNGTGSADLPQRFGKTGFTSFELGQSSLSTAAGPLAMGISTETQWWGPGIRNAIVISNNAPGFPHLFLRTGAPVSTRAGAFEAKWIVGQLAESAFFDTASVSGTRSISGVVGTFQPAVEPNLTLGIARTVFAQVSGTAAVPARLFDVLVRSGRQPPVADTSERNGADQVFSLFGRWIFPEDGFEVYAEWARTELPASVRDFLVAPNHTQGYTLGLQWARPVRGSSLVRLQTELTQLEMSPTYRQRPVRSYYVSRSVPQGYTQRGQVIGASIGPGASSQWLAADYLDPQWSVGALAGRIRWENDAYYTQAGDGRLFLAHDVSMFWGVRGQYRFPRLDVSAEFIRQNRLNFLFQNWSSTFEGENAVDKLNTTFRLMLSYPYGR